MTAPPSCSSPGPMPQPPSSSAAAISAATRLMAPRRAPRTSGPARPWLPPRGSCRPGPPAAPTPDASVWADAPPAVDLGARDGHAVALRRRSRARLRSACPGSGRQLQLQRALAAAVAHAAVEPRDALARAQAPAAERPAGVGRAGARRAPADLVDPAVLPAVGVAADRARRTGRRRRSARREQLPKSCSFSLPGLLRTSAASAVPSPAVQRRPADAHLRRARGDASWSGRCRRGRRPAG